MSSEGGQVVALYLERRAQALERARQRREEAELEARRVARREELAEQTRLAQAARAALPWWRKALTILGFYETGTGPR